jgi:hypothetical protein
MIRRENSGKNGHMRNGNFLKYESADTKNRSIKE